METLQQQLITTEDKIISPLVEVLESVIPQPNGTHPESSKSIKESLSDLFPEQAYEEKDIQKAREILGSLADEYSPQELKDVVVEIKFLVGSWLDDFEREIFGGLTLAELIHEKGGQ